ncbi:inorganic phosphate transporter [Leptospira noguchii]|uniref:Phosphate transporter n=1 Tax=Leptospira noguchii TaxID=28182 RepID=A0A9Q8VRD0_9LEPT|nr:inorganic phosphate transporter [Leptospira noguchii]EMI71427.1 phosphate transporter family protein [Leptospira noguchii str. Bonito]EMS84976.1 phosphate transporter family protein [Leptospira noguchii str. Cascata]TQE82947.1 phosphate permease [Leptospira noguchii]UOG31706.1 inorganic phosphate transporter [Leptospira noguchii]UOG33176.1 inorganic phosphate transporter [Leptospira noguchii]
MDFFLIIVVLMAILGVGDLLVGVSNDAVNFTNSAVGSKASSKRIILVVAGIGIILGALSSSGMMEVARKGIFHPSGFALQDLMFLFLAVMLTDIVLLDLYNTLGLPTSTTVSLVFELLGAALAIALLKTGTLQGAFQIINSESALKIIFGIVTSVIVAFFSGIILQFVFRFIFSFNLKNSMKYFGGLFGGLSITTVIFFTLLSAMKGSTFIPKEIIDYLNKNFTNILLISFVGFSVLFQILVLLEWNILKFLVLVGTGSLAMAFASNDLVNFIGVPLASFTTWTLIQQTGDANILATGLAESVQTPNFILLGAACIMLFSLWFSKKAESVTQTEVTLGSQGETLESFNTSLVARVFVQIALGIYTPIKAILPAKVRSFIGKRFEQKNSFEIVRMHETEAFDLLRASVNIQISSALILIGTLYKLPLSTTFVTFMVAMGTSLTDGAWNKENSVNRVSGVLTVVGGWFFTAIIASATAGLIGSILYIFGFSSVIVLVLVAALLIFLFGRIHKKRQEAYDENLEKLITLRKHPERALSRTISSMLASLNVARKALNNVCAGYINGKKKNFKQTQKLLKDLKKMRENSLSSFLSIANKYLEEEDLSSIHPITESINHLDRITESIWNILRTSSNGISSFHEISKDEKEEVKELRKSATNLMELIADSDKFPDLLEKARSEKKTKNLEKIKQNIYKSQMKRIKKGDSKLKSSVSYFVIIDELIDINDNLLSLAEELSVAIPWTERKKIELQSKSILAFKAEEKRKKK